MLFASLHLAAILLGLFIAGVCAAPTETDSLYDVYFKDDPGRWQSFIHNVFDRLDKNNDRTLTPDEFEAALKSAKREISRDTDEWLFDFADFDADHDGKVTEDEWESHVRAVLQSHTLDDVKSLQMPFKMQTVMEQLPDRYWPLWSCPDGERNLSWKRIKDCFKGNGTCNFFSCTDQPTFIYHPEFYDDEGAGNVSMRATTPKDLPTEKQRDAVMAIPTSEARFQTADGSQLAEQKTKRLRIAWDALMLTMNVAFMTVCIVTISELGSMVMLPFAIILSLIWLISLISDIRR